MPLLKRLGPVSYVLMTAFTSLTYSPRAYRIRIDDEPEQTMPLWSLLLCSFDGAGEGLMLAPGADPGDGKLDLITVGDMGRWESLAKIVPFASATAAISPTRRSHAAMRRGSRWTAIRWSAPMSTARASASFRCRSNCCRCA